MKNTNSNRGWPLQLIGFFEHPSSKISIPLSILGVVFFTALIVIGILAIGWLLADLLSGDQKRAADATKAALALLPPANWLLDNNAPKKTSKDLVSFARKCDFYTRLVNCFCATQSDFMGLPEEVKREWGVMF